MGSTFYGQVRFCGGILFDLIGNICVSKFSF